MIKLLRSLYNYIVYYGVVKRLKIYKKLLCLYQTAYDEEAKSGDLLLTLYGAVQVYGMCDALHELNHNSELANYPELYKQRPIPTGYYWFTLDKEGWYERIKCIKAAINICELKLKTNDSN